MAATAELAIVIRARDEASGALDRVGKKGLDIGRLLRRGALAGGVAVAGIGIAAVKMASDFETAFAEVTTLFDAPKAQIDALQQGVLDLSAEMGLNAVETTKALYQAISAGVEPAEALAFIEQNAKLAIGGVTDLGTAVDLTTTVINAFGLGLAETERISDVLFTGVRLGKTTIKELGQSLFQVAPVAAASGVSIEQVTAALATLTASGVPTRVATTNLRQAIVELGKSGTVANKAFQEVAGVGFRDFIAAGGDMGQVMGLLRQAAEEQGIAVSDLFGSIEGGLAAQILAGEGAEKFADALRAMGDTGGATQEAFEKMNATFGRQFKILKSQVQVAMIEIGLRILPLLTKGLQKLIPFLQENVPKAVAKLKEAWESVRPKVELVAGVLAKLGRVIKNDVLPAVMNILNFLKNNQEILAAMAIAIAIVLVPAFVAWAIAAGAAAVATIAATLPIILIIAAIALLVLGILLLVKHWDEVTAFLKAAWTATMSFLLSSVGQLRDFFVGNFVRIKDLVIAAWQATISFIVEKAIWVKDQIVAKWGTMKTKVIEIVTGIKDSIVGKFNEVVGFVSGLGTRLFDAGKNAFTMLSDGIKSGLNAALGVIESGLNKLINGVNRVIRGLNKFDVFDVVPDIPTISTVSIPRLAHGAIVTRPTLALIGDAGPEAVVPLGRGGGLGREIHVHFHGPLMGDAFQMRGLARVLQRELDALERGA